ncbi:MBL fold metallo-hydrolase RNA specificity domain-containing protein [Mucilaginibacter myungsuensis]|uniref:MBL fold metallo-hydrolase n=1 Tax=Mucilaginibacter myungsuensis TaxID=649104 RepID=A0A929PWQ6_9SPHI|nr:MBL fold metallo-hydrolase [Mucilaginibacter myungsuensis]MBE9661432.1 MBL fold metallo-hydrolase [Mucilaginibacter myungsuensis]MDN3597575.1 MBL fold metallo-hydrolase [Mucilaginibacter myungsuensis]
MYITFHGAARNVTGSKHLLQLNNGTNILLDCGMFQGLGEHTADFNEHFGFNPKKVQHLVLSHAHIDHCGLIPRLVAEGFSGPIYCTPPTLDLARILLLDSAKIQEQDSAYTNKRRRKKGQPEIEVLYTEQDAEQALKQFKTIEYHEEYQITPDVRLYFSDAGHVVGSAVTHLTVTEDGKDTHITFSGDVGRYGDLILKSPQNFRQSDYILMESTYGDSLHADIGPIEDALRDIIQETCIKNKGKVIIPAFSVGRTQELLYALNSLELKGQLPDVPVYVDSPLSTKATEVLKDHPEVFNRDVHEVMKKDADPFGFKGLRFIEDTAESVALNTSTEACVIISSSGMAEAGRVKHHIKNNIHDPNCTILIVGYCEPNSLGGHLLAGDKQVYIFGDKYDVVSNVKSISSMSAHGDYEDLLRFLSSQDASKVSKVFLVHGEYDIQQRFAERLKEQGFSNVEIPSQHQKVKLR